jgi:carboxypeptidase D
MFLSADTSILLPLLGLLATQYARVDAALQLSSSSPNVYNGMPSGDYDTGWQQCKCARNTSAKTVRRIHTCSDFRVTEKLPGIDFDLGNHYAGNIAVQRPNHPNNTLFFWAFEHQNGSLTAPSGQNDDAPWAIWLQGGCVEP